MNKSSLPPPHPSLPSPPVTGSQSQPSYGYVYPPYYTYGSHYAQAYYPQMAPLAEFNSSSANATNKINGTPIHSMSAWYQPGNVRCSYPDCKFFGSHKSVEIHKMDRHLIYPPDWEKRNKRPEWDADPSLKGKPVPIQGTSVVLDTPELIDAWIAERKMRFPTSARVEEKKRKKAEAVERGQLDLHPPHPGRPPKRQKINAQTFSGRGRGSHMHVSHGKTMTGGNLRNRWKPKEGQEPAPEANVAPAPPFPENGDKESDDDDAAPEELSSKTTELPESVHDVQAILPTPRTQEQRRLKELHPRGPPTNPFSSRPALLRNLLLPEIRMTVSNLSQAIRFIVDNDFLRNVELKPGQAAEQQKICVLSSQKSSD